MCAKDICGWVPIHTLDQHLLNTCISNKTWWTSQSTLCRHSINILIDTQLIVSHRQSRVSSTSLLDCRSSPHPPRAREERPWLVTCYFDDWEQQGGVLSNQAVCHGELCDDWVSIDSQLRVLVNTGAISYLGYLSTTTIFFCPKGCCCGENTKNLSLLDSQHLGDWGYEAMISTVKWNLY